MDSFPVSQGCYFLKTSDGEEKKRQLWLMGISKETKLGRTWVMVYIRGCISVTCGAGWAQPIV